MRSILTAITALALLGGTFACSKNDEATATSATSPAASDAGRDVSTQSGICGVLTSNLERCASTKTDCDDKIASDCPKLNGLLNTKALDGAVSCLGSAQCGE